jgi:hypothetical protein
MDQCRTQPRTSSRVRVRMGGAILLVLFICIGLHSAKKKVLSCRRLLDPAQAARNYKALC